MRCKAKRPALGSLSVLTTSASLVMFLAGPVAAQEAALEEIIVTATKRAENIKDIPMSVEVVGGEAINDYRIVTLEDLSATIPNFVVAEGITNNNVAMRTSRSGVRSAITLRCASRIPIRTVATDSTTTSPRGGGRTPERKMRCG